jgi:hypothetical protein
MDCMAKQGGTQYLTITESMAPFLCMRKLKFGEAMLAA